MESPRWKDVDAALANLASAVEHARAHSRAAPAATIEEAPQTLDDAPASLLVATIEEAAHAQDDAQAALLSHSPPSLETKLPSIFASTNSNDVDLMQRVYSGVLPLPCTVGVRDDASLFQLRVASELSRREALIRDTGLDDLWAMQRREMREHEHMHDAFFAGQWPHDFKDSCAGRLPPPLPPVPGRTKEELLQELRHVSEQGYQAAMAAMRGQALTM